MQRGRSPETVIETTNSIRVHPLCTFIVRTLFLDVNDTY